MSPSTKDAASSAKDGASLRTPEANADDTSVFSACVSASRMGARETSTTHCRAHALRSDAPTVSRVLVGTGARMERHAQ